MEIANKEEIIVGWAAIEKDLNRTRRTIRRWMAAKKFPIEFSKKTGEPYLKKSRYYRWLLT